MNDALRDRLDAFVRANSPGLSAAAEALDAAARRELSGRPTRTGDTWMPDLPAPDWIAPRHLDRIGCFRVGHKVFVGAGKKPRTITELFVTRDGAARARFGRSVPYDLRDLTLAGPNGDGVGA